MSSLGPPKEPETWREAIKAKLQAKLDAGYTLYGDRSDGAYIARTRDGDYIVEPGQARAQRERRQLRKSS